MMMQNQAQMDSVLQDKNLLDGNKDQPGKTAQHLDKKNNLFFLRVPSVVSMLC